MSLSISVRVDRASAFKDLDDLEDGVDIGCLVHGHGELACASTMAGRTDEAEFVGLADGDVVHGGDVVDAGALLAWVVGSGARLPRVGVDEGRVVECGFAERHRRLDDQMRAAERGEGQCGRGNRAADETHYAVAVGIFVECSCRDCENGSVCVCCEATLDRLESCVSVFSRSVSVRLAQSNKQKETSVLVRKRTERVLTEEEDASSGFICCEREVGDRLGSAVNETRPFLL